MLLFVCFSQRKFSVVYEKKKSTSESTKFKKGSVTENQVRKISTMKMK